MHEAPEERIIAKTDRCRVPDEGGPWVQIATFCRAVHDGPTGWQPTSLIDRVALGPASVGRLAEGRPHRVTLTLALSLIAGSIRGSGRVRVECVLPGGRREPGLTETVSFATDRSVVRLALPVPLRVDRAGIYRFGVYYRDRLLTRLPVLVVAPADVPGPTTARSLPRRRQSHTREQAGRVPRRST